MSAKRSSPLFPPLSNFFPALKPRLLHLTSGNYNNGSPRLEGEETLISEETKEEEDVVKVELRIGGMTVSLH